MEQDPKLISIYMRSIAPVRQELINVCEHSDTFVVYVGVEFAMCEGKTKKSS